MSQYKSVRKTLYSMVKHHPIPLMLSESIEVKLNEACPERKREINLILMAVQLEIVQEMQRLRHAAAPTVLLFPKLIRWMVRDPKIQEYEASWCINTWAMALSLLPFEDDILLPIEDTK